MKPRSRSAQYVTLLAATITLLLAPLVWAAPQYKVLHSFGGNGGGGLWSSVTFGKDGNLYGATSGGGEYNQGVVFRLIPTESGYWLSTVLHSFPSSTHDGAGPNGGLIQDALGNWYGTTEGGGDYNAGTVFELGQGVGIWTESALYRFGSQNNDGGGDPHAGVVMDGNGNLYGTGPYGGTYEGGTVYELTPGSGGWSETVLHEFDGNTGDGGRPFAGVILDSAGNLYGTTEGGGAHIYGTVYELQHASSGWRERILHSFPAFPKDGHTPGWGNLAMDGAGSLYGTTAGGGCCGGIVYRLTPDAGGRWKYTILYEFRGGATGDEPGAGVVMDKAGVLYGTAIDGGYGGCGVVYKLAPSKGGKWKYTVLHTFTGEDGCQPDANLILDSKGNLYGTTATGGAGGYGVAFELTP